MTLPAFDTYAYVKKLQDAGFTEQEAAAQAELQSEILSSLVTEKLTTKKDDLEKALIKIDGKFTLLKWMIGISLGGISFTLGIAITILIKLFVHP